jgi:hypothetical protein
MVDGSWSSQQQYDAHASQGNGYAGPEPLCLRLAEWLARDLPEPDFLMGEFLSTTSRVELVAPTGLGKTNFCLALAVAMAAGASFLHWRVPRASRVLYVDGEMSRRLLRRRLADAVRRLGKRPETLAILSRDDVEEMAPLNSPDGQSFIDRLILQLGGIDFVFFDNVMSLIAGDMKEEESWSLTLPWVKGLTRKSIGSLWVHHTGHNEERGYGTSTREWQLDTVMLMQRIERADTDIAFNLTFPKSRERAPHNRQDFESVAITLVDDQWKNETVAPVAHKKLTARENLLLDELRNTLAAAGTVAPDTVNYPVGVRVVSVAIWRATVFQNGIYEETHSGRSTWSRERGRLIDKGKVRIWGDFAWIV